MSAQIIQIKPFQEARDRARNPYPYQFMAEVSAHWVDFLMKLGAIPNPPKE